MSSTLRDEIQTLLVPADVIINGSRPWDIQIHDERTYGRVLRHGTLGLGESYLDGWWDAPQLDEFIFRVLRARLPEKMHLKWRLVKVLPALLLNYQSPARAFQVGREHYDKGNKLYQAMLDRRMTYSCGYWKNAATLDAAQEAKLELVCRKLQLKPGQHVLDIGCGWGSFMKYAAEKYGVSCVGLTVSREQVALGQELCRGLPIEFRLQDYRACQEEFDAVVSIGMFEHVGQKNYRTFLQVAAHCLHDDGLFLLHTFGAAVSTHVPEPWFHQYIFPNGTIPSVAQIGRAAEHLFVMEDWHNFGPDYSPTLLAWHRNFIEHWPELKNQYSERFYRMWSYYLLALAGCFRARELQLWQIVFSKHGFSGGYTPVR